MAFLKERPLQPLFGVGDLHMRKDGSCCVTVINNRKEKVYGLLAKMASMDICQRDMQQNGATAA